MVPAGGGKHAELQSWGAMAAANEARTVRMMSSEQQQQLQHQHQHQQGQQKEQQQQQQQTANGRRSVGSGGSVKHLFSRVLVRGEGGVGAEDPPPDRGSQPGHGEGRGVGLAHFGERNNSMPSVTSDAVTPSVGRTTSFKQMYELGGPPGYTGSVGGGREGGAVNAMHDRGVRGVAVAAAGPVGGSLNGVVDDHEVAGGGRRRNWPGVGGDDPMKEERRRSEEKTPDPRLV